MTKPIQVQEGEIMAYAGNKMSRADELERAIDRKQWQWVVDPFYGSGGLTKAFLTGHSADFPIAGEVFTPLRSLYKKTIDLDWLCFRVLQDISETGESAFWEKARSCLTFDEYFYTNAEAFVILNNLSFGCGMRFNKKTGRHNLKLAEEKLDNLKKRGKFIDPIVLRPSTVYGCWRSALMAAGGRNSIALLDPPYLYADSIYPLENPSECGVPPVKLAMERGYGAIVAYNSNNLDLDYWFNDAAKKHGYSCQMTITDWDTKYSAKSTKKKSTEAMWIFEKEAPHGH